MGLLILGITVGIVIGVFLSIPVASAIKVSMIWIWSKVKSLFKKKEAKK
jgi:hypothetical protein